MLLELELEFLLRILKNIKECRSVTVVDLS